MSISNPLFFSQTIRHAQLVPLLILPFLFHMQKRIEISDSSRLLKNVASVAETRIYALQGENEAKKHSLHGVNEHFEPNFDAVSADSEQSETSSAVVFQQPAR
ncbi:MAG: hypothetical protein KQH63_21085 [Desulfobulbaceae bacterium]|nr:hypothetical protein [Desulfobulbaceae bacterium]